MEWDPQKVLANIQAAQTDDLLDRVTAYRQGMEPEALELIEAELHRRGVTATAIEERRQGYERECLFHADGAAMMCSFCRKPAVEQRWGWHKLWSRVPLFPRPLRYCKEHVSVTTPADPRPPA
jgi:hypothetical protein